MTVSARDVAAELRERLPGLPTKKLHKLLYKCQGHHLAQFAEPLFADAIFAWDMGPVVPSLWYAEKHGAEDDTAPRQPLTNAELNTIGYVASRYGHMTGRELEILSHGEDPWRDANVGRLPGSSARITTEAIRAYFLAADQADREEELTFDSETLRALFARGVERAKQPAEVDDPDQVRAWPSRAA